MEILGRPSKKINSSLASAHHFGCGCRRGNVALQPPAATVAQAALQLRSVAGVARSSAEVIDPLQQRRLRIVRLGRRIDLDESSCRSRLLAEDQHSGT